MSSMFGHNVYQTTGNINRARGWMIHLWSDSMALVSEVLQTGYDFWGSSCTFICNWQSTSETLIKQNPWKSVREMSQITGVSILTISDHLKTIGKVKKLDKWIQHKLSKDQSIWCFEVCSMLNLRNLNDTFDRIVIFD